MNKYVNLASLPKGDALALARAGGRTIFGDEDAVSHAYSALMEYWIGRSLPVAVGQDDDEFGDLVDQVEGEFRAGFDEAMNAACASNKSRAILDRIDMLATENCMLAWRLQSLVALMVGRFPPTNRTTCP